LEELPSMQYSELNHDHEHCVVAQPQQS